MATILSLLEKITQLLLGILYGDKTDCREEEGIPSFSSHFLRSFDFKVWGFYSFLQSRLGANSKLN